LHPPHRLLPARRRTTTSTVSTAQPASTSATSHPIK
jgi:hypothetical protein